ncbi:heterokaryon incompatibility protein-domain-containing protein [Diaporthe eres]|nr:heterokaryon incompatibility protein-domain-containing protein [Diaporthe eres]
MSVATKASSDDLHREIEAKLSGTSRLPLYEYEDLPSGTHIRFFILQQGRVDDPLIGSMKTAPLSDPSTKYEAVSYVWGTDVMDLLISVDGRKLPITKNLDAALSQKDNDEKGYQVALMGQIYETSSCTMVCLGVGQRLAEAEHARNVAILVDKVEPTDPLVTDIKWMTSWNAMILHPWYYRRWVVQEVTRAPRACILWAGVEIDWRHILRFNYWLNLRAQHVTTTLTTPKQISSIHLQLYASRYKKESKLFTGELKLDRLKEMTTIDILGRGRSLQVGEPKDKIYALMHLLTSGGKTLQPDYAATTSHLDVYRDFAIKYTEDKADLDLLNCVEHNQNTFDQETIPSWVPRWDVGGHPEPMLNPMDRIITGDTSQDYPAVQSFTATAGGSALRVRAVVFDIVKYVSETIKWQLGSPTSQIVGQVVALWTQIRSQSKEFPGPHQERLSLAFLSAICQGTHNGDWDKFKESMLAFAQLLQSEDPDPDRFPTTDKKAERVSRFGTRTSGNRRLILLGRGHYAVAPELTREDDICVVIIGARCPFILRKVAVAGVDEFHYKLIGAAYVQSKHVHVKNEIPLALGEESAGDETYD